MIARRSLGPAALALAMPAMAACSPTVKVQVPDKPIEINMNIRIEQEVRVKIDRELDSVFSSNPELFGVPTPQKPVNQTSGKGATR